MKFNDARKLIISVAVCQLAGLIGMWFIGSSITTWYAALEKPWLNPPNWVFGPVWVTLYLLMGIAAYLVWREGLERDDVKKALCMFANQLVLNLSWSIIFFGFHNIFFALIVIAILLPVIYSTICYFRKISLTASRLLIPYLVWVGFAAYLNLAIWLLN